MISNDNIKSLEKSIIYLDKLLLNKKPDHEKINDLLYKIRQKILIFKIKLNELELKGGIYDKKTMYFKKRLEIIVNNLNLVDDYNSKILVHNQKKSIDTLTIVNTIFLPLALITGYFGMNFKSMGCPSRATGIFTVNNGQMLVFTLFILISTIIILLFKLNIIPG